MFFFRAQGKAPQEAGPRWFCKPIENRAMPLDNRDAEAQRLKRRRIELARAALLHAAP
jgi:hypothetical protein